MPLSLLLRTTEIYWWLLLQYDTSTTRVPDTASYSTVCCAVLLQGLAATMPLDTGITVASEGALHLYKQTV